MEDIRKHVIAGFAVALLTLAIIGALCTASARRADTVEDSQQQVEVAATLAPTTT